MGKDGYSNFERVELFLERVEKLKNNSLIRDEKLKRVSFWSKYDEEKGHWFELLGTNNEPINMESFEALIATFRLIYMQKEPTHIEKVYTVVYDSIQLDKRHKVQSFKQNWQRALEENSHLVAEGGEFIKLDDVLKNWLYGELFHSDKRKRKFVKKWGKPLEAEVVFIINFLCPYIFWLGDFIQDGLDKNLFKFST